ncbi:MAG: RecX family transcriptional regulator [Bacteroidetes bacterium]|nr:RecX family transcriptional regulator [Bacteroidota bacterium]MCK5764872.1 RecX family transcriptional regulator [Bacteroidales bacterium]
MSAPKTTHTKYIFEKAKHYCAYQERSVFEVKNKLYLWKVRPEVARKIIKSLEEENYLNEERFARVFAGGKFRIKKWGRNKIIAGLRAKKIPDPIIQIGLDEIDEYQYERTLQEVIEKKKSSMDDQESFNNRNKIFIFALSRGYEKHLILKYL